MAIQKESSLSSWLNNWNFDILGWQVYIGDVVENAIDWAISWINYVLSWAESAYDWARTAWDKAVEVGLNAWKDLVKEANKIWNYIETWWDDLGDWWLTKITLIKGLIDAAEDFLQDLIGDVQRELNKLDAAWDSFWRNTWPQLLNDFSELGVRVGNFFTVTLPTLASKLDLGKAFNDFRLEWQTLFDFWGGFGREVMEFFTDPIKWLFDRLETFMDRYW